MDEGPKRWSDQPLFVLQSTLLHFEANFGQAVRLNLS